MRNNVVFCDEDGRPILREVPVEMVPRIGESVYLHLHGDYIVADIRHSFIPDFPATKKVLELGKSLSQEIHVFLKKKEK
jgi:hypothetical protein